MEKSRLPIRSLTQYHVKLIAALLMVLDHVGAILYPDVEGLRVIGRLSFPLFAWLLTQGEAHTRHFGRYAWRLFIWGCLSQYIYWRAFGVPGQLNILFTLLVGLLCLRGARVAPAWQVAIWLAGAGVATVANMDYWGYGILIIAMLAQFQRHLLWWIGWIGLHVMLAIALPNFGTSQFPAIFAPLILISTSGRQGAKARWFYLFYPGHLLILILIRAYLS
ncbi:TraX family protein [Microcoleus sp. FACHB-1515]|uniref:TraX family protein n=1 Tax=Cyanophyceae TaxID=3028117 RepID=UPI0018EF93E3|nr:TraX family protein [Microcoleus sp. FACHB-1515]